MKHKHKGSMSKLMEREQAQRYDEMTQRADERAREQAQRADKQANHLVDVLQSSLESLKLETQLYTDKACARVRSEMLGKIQTLEDEV